MLNLNVCNVCANSVCVCVCGAVCNMLYASPSIICDKLTLTHTRTYTLSHNTLMHTHTHTHTLSLSHQQTHTHTHTLSLSLSVLCDDPQTVACTLIHTHFHPLACAVGNYAEERILAEQGIETDFNAEGSSPASKTFAYVRKQKKAHLQSSVCPF